MPIDLPCTIADAVQLSSVCDVSGGCTAGDRIIYNGGTCFQGLIPIKDCGSVAGNVGPSSTTPCRAGLVTVPSGGDF